MWRGSCRLNISVSASFVWRCLSGSALTPFPQPAHRTGHADFPELAHDYLSQSAILATAAWAQTSSLSPPGAPPTPIAPTTSSPDLINTPPGTRKTPGRCCSGPKAGPLLTLATIALVVDSLKFGPSETAA